jgi:hypothetical protein
MKIAKLGLVGLLVWAPGLAAAQQQSSEPSQSGQSTQAQASDQKQEDSLAAAARRAREQKKEAPKTTKVWDNENIPSKPDGISVIGESGSSSGNAEQSATPAATTTKAPSAAKDSAAEASKKAAISAELAEAKEHLASLTTDLDILTRKYGLDQQMYYGKIDYASDKDGAAKLKAEEDDMAAKKEEIEAAQKKIDELTAKLNQSASSTDTKPASNPQ